MYKETGIHLGFSRATLLCDRMSLFKLNSNGGSAQYLHSNWEYQDHFMGI